MLMYVLCFALKASSHPFFALSTTVLLTNHMDMSSTSLTRHGTAQEVHLSDRFMYSRPQSSHILQLVTSKLNTGVPPCAYPTTLFGEDSLGKDGGEHHSFTGILLFTTGVYRREKQADQVDQHLNIW